MKKKQKNRCEYGTGGEAATRMLESSGTRRAEADSNERVTWRQVFRSLRLEEVILHHEEEVLVEGDVWRCCKVLQIVYRVYNQTRIWTSCSPSISPTLDMSRRGWKVGMLQTTASSREGREGKGLTLGLLGLSRELEHAPPPLTTFPQHLSPLPYTSGRTL